MRKKKQSNQSQRSRLDLVDAHLADQVRAVDDDTILRLFACKCASLALEHCGNQDPRLTEAMNVARSYAGGGANQTQLAAAYTAAAEAAQAADNDAFDAQDAVEEGKAPRSAYSRAFGTARAASSAGDCCLRSALAAAEEAVIFRAILGHVFSPIEGQAFSPKLVRLFSPKMGHSFSAKLGHSDAGGIPPSRAYSLLVEKRGRRTCLERGKTLWISERS